MRALSVGEYATLKAAMARIAEALDWPVAWVLGMKSLSQDEKEAILWKNLERLLGM